MAKELTRELLWEAGIQFGHQTKRWNPKMKPYIYGEKNKIHIIDLQQTISSFDEIKKLMEKIASKNGKILFVGTKKQAKWIVKDAAERCGGFYVNQRWLGGTLTNLKTIHLRVMYLWNIERQEKSGELKLLTKKEQMLIKKEKDKLEKFLGGIKAMKELPSAVFVVDPKEEYIAVREAKKLKIPVIAICDTNVDPDEIDYVIPGNDDTARSIALITHHVADLYGEAAGLTMPEPQFKPNESFRRGEGEEGQGYHGRTFNREFLLERVRVIDSDVRKTLENLKTYNLEKIAKLVNVEHGERYEMFDKLVAVLEIKDNRLAIKEGHQVNKPEKQENKESENKE